MSTITRSMIPERPSRNEIGGIVSDGFNAIIENNVIDGASGAGIVQKNVYSSALTGSGYVITARNNIITNTQSSSAGGNGAGVSNLLTGTHSFVLVANFAADKTEGTTPLTVKFTDTSTNSPTGWKWDFGDGQTSRSSVP